MHHASARSAAFSGEKKDASCVLEVVKPNYLLPAILLPTLVHAEPADVVAAKAAIDAQEKLYAQAFKDLNPKLLEGVFEVDSVELMMGGKVIRGRKDQIEDLKKWMKTPADLTLTRTDFWLVGDMAYEYGTYKFWIRGRAKPNEAGYCWLWHKGRDGKWRSKVGFDIFTAEEVKKYSKSG